jgi:hypothetical protein
VEASRVIQAMAATTSESSKARKGTQSFPARFRGAQQEASRLALTVILKSQAEKPRGGFGMFVAAPHPARLTHRPGLMSRESSVGSFELGTS